jgi:hypothetical protein
LLWVLLAGSGVGLTGCSEVMQQTEQVTTTIDVVGEPNDPTSDLTQAADILGSGTPFSDDSNSFTDATSAPVNTSPNADEAEQSIEGQSDENVSKATSSKKSARLKTAKTDSNISR